MSEDESGGQRVLNWLARPPGKIFIWTNGGTVLFIAWAVSVPGWYGLSSLTAMTMGAGCATAGWLRLTLAMGSRSSRADLRTHWRAWAVASLITVVGIAMVYLDVPLRARFAVSRPALDRFARSLTDASPMPKPGRVGLYRLDPVETFPGGVRMLVHGAGFIDSAGFAFSPDHEPPVIGEDEYFHLTGPWYVWHESF